MPTVTGTWRRGETLVRGDWEVIVPVRVLNTAGVEILPAGVFAAGDLNHTDAEEPSLSVVVPPSTGTLPDGWQPVLKVNIYDGETETYVLVVSSDDPIDLEAIVLPQDLDDPVDMLARGRAGGLAGLDEDGDVVDADGNKILGGGGSSGGIVPDPDHPGFYLITGGALTPDPDHPGFYLIGA